MASQAKPVASSKGEALCTCSEAATHHLPVPAGERCLAPLLWKRERRIHRDKEKPVSFRARNVFPIPKFFPNCLKWRRDFSLSLPFSLLLQPFLAGRARPPAAQAAKRRRRCLIRIHRRRFCYWRTSPFPAPPLQEARGFRTFPKPGLPASRFIEATAVPSAGPHHPRSQARRTFGLGGAERLSPGTPPSPPR